MSVIKVSLNSNIGCVRQKNEDIILFNRQFYQNQSFSTTVETSVDSPLMAIVCDGMGGHKGGEFASQIASDSFLDFINMLPKGLTADDITAHLNQWAQDTHNVINAKGIAMPEYKGMGTTLVGIFTYDGHTFWVNCGDSRLYRFRDGILKQISTDHSWQELYHDKSLPSNVIYNSLGGGGDKVFIDVHEMTGKIFNGDKFIVCSDGLSDMQTDTEIETIMLSPDYSADKLVEAAREAGGLDNVSVILVEYVLM